jgi:hypothetical protein
MPINPGSPACARSPTAPRVPQEKFGQMLNLRLHSG